MKHSVVKPLWAEQKPGLRLGDEERFGGTRKCAEGKLRSLETLRASQLRLIESPTMDQNGMVWDPLKRTRASVAQMT